MPIRRMCGRSGTARFRASSTVSFGSVSTSPSGTLSRAPSTRKIPGSSNIFARRSKLNTESVQGSMTLKKLGDLYLQYQNSKVLANDLSPKHHNDQISSLHKLMSFLGQSRRIKNISTLDLQNYKRKLQGAYGSVYRLNLHISIMKAMFHWARKDDILENIPNIDAISRGKIVHKERFTFNSEQINKLLSAADVKMGETFTVACMDLPAPLGRCLHTTNIIELPHSGVRMRTVRV